MRLTFAEQSAFPQKHTGHRAINRTQLWSQKQQTQHKTQRQDKTALHTQQQTILFLLHGSHAKRGERGCSRTTLRSAATNLRIRKLNTITDKGLLLRRGRIIENNSRTQASRQDPNQRKKDAAMDKRALVEKTSRHFAMDVKKPAKESKRKCRKQPKLHKVPPSCAHEEQTLVGRGPDKTKPGALHPEDNTTNNTIGPTIRTQRHRSSIKNANVERKQNYRQTQAHLSPHDLVHSQNGLRRKRKQPSCALAVLCACALRFVGLCLGGGEGGRACKRRRNRVSDKSFFD